MSNELEAAWQDLPAAWRSHPGIKRLYRAATPAPAAQPDVPCERFAPGAVLAMASTIAPAEPATPVQAAPEPECEMPPEYWATFERSAVTAWNQRAAAAEAVLRELEACARICDTTPPYPFRPSIEAAHAIRQRAAAIRATPAQTPEGKTE